MAKTTAAAHARVLCAYVPNLRVVTERLKESELCAQPLIIFRPGQRPEVLEASSDILRTGVYPDMLLSRALSLCPKAVALPPDEPAYERAGRQVLAPSCTSHLRSRPARSA